MNPQPEVISALAERIGQNTHVERVALFGSRARGDERERSDIDLAVIGPDHLRESITREGVALYERSPSC